MRIIGGLLRRWCANTGFAASFLALRKGHARFRQADGTEKAVLFCVCRAAMQGDDEVEHEKVETQMSAI